MGQEHPQGALLRCKAIYNTNCFKSANLPTATGSQPYGHRRANVLCTNDSGLAVVELMFSNKQQFKHSTSRPGHCLFEG